MEIDVAVKLIERGILRDKVQRWADLGAGSGLFTKALSKILPAGSSILAVDKKISSITVDKHINLQTKNADFLSIDLGDRDGILMANSLHYVKDQQEFLKKVKAERLILVEYDTDKGNQWVPYPISFKKLRSIYPSAELIGQTSSAYQKDGIYSALLLF